MGPKPASTVLSPEEEAIATATAIAIATAFRQHTQLPLDDCLYALQATIPKLTRSALHRLLQRHGIEHRFTKPAHPWTNGQVERMNRTIKEATVLRYHYQTTGQLNEHLQVFLLAYDHARRLKTLRGLTPHQFICAQHQNNPDIFIQNPTHLLLGLYS